MRSSPVIRAQSAAPLDADDLVEHLAGQQPQRKADHARAVRQHPLDREMGLAGVGGAEHGGHAAVALDAVAEPENAPPRTLSDSSG